MKLWKRDCKEWTVRQVEGEPWPGHDEEGDDCYTNTHFENEEAAWDSLEKEAAAFLALSVRGLKQAREEVAHREKTVVESGEAVNAVRENREARRKQCCDAPL